MGQNRTAGKQVRTKHSKQFYKNLQNIKKATKMKWRGQGLTLQNTDKDINVCDPWNFQTQQLFNCLIINKLQNLNSLYISHHKYFQIELDKNLPNLQQLCLFSQESNKGVNKILTKIYPKIKSLEIYYEANLQNMPIVNMPSLQFLNLVGKQPRTLNQFAKGVYFNLKIIKVSHSKLASLPRFNIPLLEKIEIYNSNLSNIDQFLEGDHQNLLQINFEVNFIQEISEKISRFKRLQKICFANNKLISITKMSTKQYPNLTQIDLRLNEITQIPCLNTPNLISIFFSQNQIVKMDNFWSKPYFNLKEVDFSKNCLTSLQKVDALRLKSLILSNNHLLEKYLSFKISNNQQEVDKNVFNSSHYQSQIQYLHAQNNQFDLVPRFLVLSNMKNLKILNLAKNFIRNIQLLSQLNMENIQNLDLKENLIYSLKTFQKFKMPKIAKINLTQNLILQSHFLYRTCFLKQEFLQSGIYQLNGFESQFLQSNIDKSELQLKKKPVYQTNQKEIQKIQIYLNGNDKQSYSNSCWSSKVRNYRSTKNKKLQLRLI